MAVTTRQRLERARRLLTVQEQMRGIAERDLAATRRDLARARYDTIMSSLRLKSAAGTLREADLEQVNMLLTMEAPPSPAVPQSVAPAVGRPVVVTPPTKSAPPPAGMPPGAAPAKPVRKKS